MEANLSFEKKSSRAPLTEGCCRLAFPCMRPSAGTAPFCTSSRQTWISARPLYSVVQLLICSRPFQSKNSNVRGGGGVGEAAGRGEAKGEERKKTEEQRENADGISMHPLWDPRRWRTGNKTWLHCGRVQRGAGLCGCVVLRTYDSGRAARKTCGEESWGCKKSGFLPEFDVFALLDRVMWCFSASAVGVLHQRSGILFMMSPQLDTVWWGSRKPVLKGRFIFLILTLEVFLVMCAVWVLSAHLFILLDVCVPIEGRRDEVLLHANLVVSIALILSTESLVGFFQLDFVLLQKIHSAANTSLWHFHILFSNMIIKLHSSRMTATSPALSLLLCYAIHILLNDQPISWKVSESSCLLSWRLMFFSTHFMS